MRMWLWFSCLVMPSCDCLYWWEGRVRNNKEFQNYCGFGLRPSSGILETRKQNVSEAESVSVLRWGGETPTLFGPSERANLKHWATPIKSKSKLFYDRQSAGQSVLEQSTHLGLTTRSLLLFDSCGFVCLFGAPSLTRGRVCRLQLLLVLASSAIFGSESRRTRGRILLSHIRDFPFRRLLRLAGSRWRYSTPPPHGYNNNNSCQIHYSYLITRLIRREITRKYAIKIVINTHIRGTRTEREVEIYATNLASKTKCMSTNA
jgi:hypothetical protein